MSDGRPPDRRERKGRRPLITEEDRALWERIATSLTPLPGMRARIAARESTPPPEATARGGRGNVPAHPPAPPQPKERRQHLADRAAALAPHPHRGNSTGAPPAIAPFDRKRSRRIATGRMPIEARLDLHGLRQAEAHGRLRSFLASCSARGMSTVLVVTGKGTPRSDEDDGAPWWAAGEQRGVLRRSLPHWLDDPEIRIFVASYTTAATRHGGEGAVYIHLRRRTPPR